MLVYKMKLIVSTHFGRLANKPKKTITIISDRFQSIIIQFELHLRDAKFWHFWHRLTDICIFFSFLVWCFGACLAPTWYMRDISFLLFFLPPVSRKNTMMKQYYYAASAFANQFQIHHVITLTRQSPLSTWDWNDNRNECGD